MAISDLPSDPVMLLSVVNLKLRDYYGSLEALCDDLNVPQQELTDKLAAVGCCYYADRNQFM